MSATSWLVTCMCCGLESRRASVARMAAVVALGDGWRAIGEQWLCAGCVAQRDARGGLGFALHRRLPPWHPEGSTLDRRST